MASRYMNYLRKNAKVVLVFMGIVCMITFVVGTALIDLANNVRRGAQDPNPVVVTWTGGSVHQNELQGLRYRHGLTYQFLKSVLAACLQRGGQPMVNGRPVTREELERDQADVGIAIEGRDESIVQTMVLAEEARKMGVAVDRDAVIDFLRQISSPELREGDWLQIAQEVLTNQHLSVNQLFDHLAYELKAQHVRMLAMSGLYAQRVGPIVPPGQAFELFSRLNRKLTIEAYPVAVEPLISQVKGEPSEAEIQKLFDEGKHRDPDPTMDEPGFRKPHKLAFKYLKISYTPFLDEAKKQITDEQIEEAYKKDIEQGLHKVQELPPSTDKKDDAEKPADDSEKKPDDKPKPDDQPAPPEASPDKPVEKKTDEKSAQPPDGCDAEDPPTEDQAK